MNEYLAHESLDRTVDLFLTALVDRGFAGDVHADMANRTVFSTDNSIYQVLPGAVLFPKDGADIELAVTLARSHRVPLSPRGGGTGTNGQSLTRGVIIDLSRHMTAIGHLDLENGLVTVEPGVVLDQLNSFLRPHGYFFPPTVSTSSRATIGGMVATDASGKGSRIYGKTSAYIASLDVVLSDGQPLTVAPLPVDAVRHLAKKDTVVGAIYRETLRVVEENRQEIADVFPKMNRGLTGYNLQNVLDGNGCFNLCYLLAGSEGTLAITKSITLRIRKRPLYRALVPVRYREFQTALADVQRLLESGPAAIEIIDDKILTLAQNDPIWAAIESVLGDGMAVPIGGLNFLEFLGDTAEEIDRGVAALTRILEDGPPIFIDWKIVTDADTITSLWSLRERAVGLLGRVSPDEQGTPFVEDAAVPPENLADFIREFREVLDRHGLSYGMYGHADVGCLHVRPAMNMRDSRYTSLIRPISSEVAKLAKKYGGLLWGEHGRGFRSEYSPFFFGAKLYAELCALKMVFDPDNIFNPGKLAHPQGSRHIERIDAVPLRGERDQGISGPLASTYAKAVACNGNAACFNWDAFDVMCPSYKATRDRTQSPKGRAALLREWAYLKSRPETERSAADLSSVESALRQSLSGCLSCKACSNQCPVKVDIPAMKAEFLQAYYTNRRRPLRDRFAANMERGLQLARRLPRVANLGAALAEVAGLNRVLGLVDLPRLRPAKRQHFLIPSVLERLAALPAAEKRRSVILLEDSFTSSFDGVVVETVDALLRGLGYQVYRSPPLVNGKVAYVLGRLDLFAKIACDTVKKQQQLLETQITVVGIEPVVLALQGHEYRGHGAERDENAVAVLSLDEFLEREIEAGRIPRRSPSAGSVHYSLFLHCTEKTAQPKAAKRWTDVFTAFGLIAQPAATGCCGMAGLYGHEAENAPTSRKLFEMSWAPKLAEVGRGTALATGFSCRCQSSRMGHAVDHPAVVLLRALQHENAASSPQP